MSQSRQLAAIMFTDIVGYTALMGEDEERAFDLLNKNRKLQKRLIEQYNGRWIKELGDGVLASFTTVINAVNSASAIMKGCAEIEGLQLRIGIHLGDVVFDNDDVFGDGVNIASRLQTLALPGCVWISEAVHRSISNKKEINTKFVREENLKHVKEPVRIYEVITDETKPQSNSKTVEPIQKNIEKSIAVLPFADMSSDKDQEYLGDGIAEELLNILSQVKQLKVIGRTSSFSFKGTKTDLKMIGLILDTENILEGSVQKAGNRLRITAQLINAASGYHLWSQRYDRQMDDIFALQDDICSKIAENLKVTLLEDHKTAVEKRPTDNLHAYEMFLKGEFYYKKYSAAGFEKAHEYFKKAVELDPNYADAWWYLGLTYWGTGEWLSLEEKEVVETSRYCAKKAIEIDETNSHAHFLLSIIYINYDQDWAEAGIELELGKKYTRTPYPLVFLPLEPWYRSMLYGDFDFAVRQLQKGIENDPLSILYLFHLALIHLHEREYEKTRIILNRILELDSEYNEAWRPMSLSYLFAGEYELAEECARKYYDALKGNANSAANLIFCLAASGKKEEGQQLYKKVKDTIPAFQFPASLHAKANIYLGKVDEAFEYLNKALEERNTFLFNLKHSPEWDLFRPDPRFQKVLERMNFPK